MKILKIIATFILVFVFSLGIYTNVQNYKAITQLLDNQGLYITLQVYFNELNAERNRLLEEKVQEKADKENKPSFEYMQSVTVRVINVLDPETNRSGVGTGTIVKVTDDFTYILTNRHMAPTMDSLVYVEKNDAVYQTEIIKIGFVRDLALLKISGTIPNTGVVKGFAKCNEQDKVYSVGMYMGFYDIYTEGTVAGWWKDSRLMNMPCLSGCSGSGIFDKDGNMVAVLYAGTAYSLFGFDTAKAICVPYIAVYAFLEDIL